MGIKSFGSSGEIEETLAELNISSINTTRLSISWRGAVSKREGANLPIGWPR
jgi:hypothetical protein